MYGRDCPEQSKDQKIIYWRFRLILGILGVVQQERLDKRHCGTNSLSKGFLQCLQKHSMIQSLPTIQCINSQEVSEDVEAKIVHLAFALTGRCVRQL